MRIHYLTLLTLVLLIHGCTGVVGSESRAIQEVEDSGGEAVRDDTLPAIRW